MTEDLLKHGATALGDTEMVRLLIRWGADVKPKDQYGIRAVEHAVASLEEGTAGDGGVRQRQWDLVGILAAEEDVRLSVAYRDWLWMIVLRWSSVVSDGKCFARRK